MTKIVAFSDLHGQPFPDIAECDLLIIAGDICPCNNHNIYYQANWLNDQFDNWLKSVPAKKVVVIAGNHDLVFEQEPGLINKNHFTYLQDSGIIYEGMKIWGSPWVKKIWGAFNLRQEDLQAKWDLIPEDTDILVIHSPPFGYGDDVTTVDEERHPELVEHVGCPFLLEKIRKIKPKLVVFGHVHSGRGEWQIGNTTMTNVSVVDEQYKICAAPWVRKFVS